MFANVKLCACLTFGLWLITRKTNCTMKKDWSDLLAWAVPLVTWQVRNWLFWDFRCIERGLKGRPHPRVMKFVLSATLTRDPAKIAQLDLYCPMYIAPSAEENRYQLPKQLKAFKLVRLCKQSSVLLASVYTNHSYKLWKWWRNQLFPVMNLAKTTLYHLCLS